MEILSNIISMLMIIVIICIPIYHLKFSKSARYTKELMQITTLHRELNEIMLIINKHWDFKDDKDLKKRIDTFKPERCIKEYKLLKEFSDILFNIKKDLCEKSQTQ